MTRTGLPSVRSVGTPPCRVCRTYGPHKACWLRARKIIGGGVGQGSGLTSVAGVAGKSGTAFSPVQRADFGMHARGFRLLRNWSGLERIGLVFRN